MTDLQSVEDVLTREGWNGPDFLDKGDRGGRTSWGISERAHPEAWTHGPPSQDQARAIYIREYVLPWAWVPDDRLRALLVDWSVTSGQSAATKGLQIAVIADVDGVLGADTKRLTLASLCAGRPVVAAVIRARAEHYMALALDEPRLRVMMNVGNPLQVKFLRGWMRRCLEFVS